MRFEENSILYRKSIQFSLDIINIYKYLSIEKKEFIMSKQLLRCGTSIGANISESFNAQSEKDLISKLYIALKDTSESEYWINLLTKSNYLQNSCSIKLLDSLKEITKILSTIIKNTKAKEETIH